MTIRVFRDRIELGDFTLNVTPTGFSFNGGIASSSFSSWSNVGKSAGFLSCGSVTPFTPGPTYPFTAEILRIPFASGGSKSEVIGSGLSGLTSAPGNWRTLGFSSETDGYFTIFDSISRGTLNKFSFNKFGNSAQVGLLWSLASLVGGVCPLSTKDYGYSILGSSNAIRIAKFPFSSDAVSNLNLFNIPSLLAYPGISFGLGNNNLEKGFVIQTEITPSASVITKFRKILFASESQVTDLYPITPGTYTYISSYQSTTAANFIRSPAVGSPQLWIPTANFNTKIPFATEVASEDSIVSIGTPTIPAPAPGIGMNYAGSFSSAENGYSQVRHDISPSTSYYLTKFNFASSNFGVDSSAYATLTNFGYENKAAHQQ